MGLTSMTGYGQGQAGDELLVRIEARSVNHRYTDFAIRLPREYAFLEETIRDVLGEYVQRGRVEVLISIEDFREDPRTVKIDWGLLHGYNEAISSISEQLNVEPTNRGDYLLSLPGVLQPVAVDDKEQALLERLVRDASKAAAEALVTMRKAEGQRIAVVLNSYLDDLSDSLGEITLLAGEVPIEQQERLNKRVQELAGDLQPDPHRLTTEIAILADRSNIDEELVRLKSHISEFRTALQQTGAVGRKLDFLLQEMNREVNTIGSKTTHLVISKWVVEAKSAIEKLREQIQNVE
ncbi:MAG: YicC family protein [Firmicutes bacterium]|nr:YicC family protein [Bacillota bacterium]